MQPIRDMGFQPMMESFELQSDLLFDATITGWKPVSRLSCKTTAQTHYNIAWLSACHRIPGQIL
jgi:hypothetical protein